MKMNLSTNTQKRKGGFTLLELLIVIAIIAILSIALVFLLNPAETLKKARDAQRISDLKTLKTALGVMLTATSTPSLDGTFGSTGTGICLTTGAGAVRVGTIAYSSPTSPTLLSLAVGSDSTGTFTTATRSVGSLAGNIDGTGWIPVNLKALTGGSPISNFPTDPTNVATAATSSLVYRYACQNGSATSKPAFVFEINAVLESSAFTIDDNKMSTDGGDNIWFFETGNSLNLLPAGGGGVF